MSSGVANRPIGFTPSISASLYPPPAAWSAKSISVFTHPGQTAFTRTPRPTPPHRRHRPSQPPQSRLRSVIGRPVRHPHQPGNRCHIHNAPAPPLQHHRPKPLRQQKRSQQIHLQPPPKLRSLHRLRRRNKADPGVIHQHIHPPPPLAHHLHRSRHHSLIRYISRYLLNVDPSPSHLRNRPHASLHIHQQ